MLSRTSFATFVLWILLCITFSAKAQTWKTYDPGLGTTPDIQGFDFVNDGTSPNPSVADGALHQGLTSYTGFQYWTSNVPVPNFSTDFTLEAQIKVTSSTMEQNNTPHMGYYLAASDAQNHSFIVGIANNYVEIRTANTPTGISVISFNTTDRYHLYRIHITRGVGSLYIDNNFIVSSNVGAELGNNTVYFGDGTTLGASETQLKLFRYTITPVTLLIDPSQIFRTGS